MTRLPARKLLTLAALAAWGALGASPALAQTQPQPQPYSDSHSDDYFYGGLSLGQSRAKIDEQRISALLLGAGLATTSFHRDETDTAYKLFLGYQFNRHWGLEAGYVDLGHFGFQSTTTPAGTLDGQIRLKGINLDLVGTLPFTERLSAIGRLGAQRTRARDHFSATGAVSLLQTDPSQTETRAKAGLGLQWAVSRSLLLRAEAERYRVNDAVGNRGDVNLLSLSLVMPFGRAAAPQRRPVAAAQTPAPAQAQAVAPAQVPPPVPAARAVVAPAVAAPPPPVLVPPARRRVSFSAESLFGFDQTEISPQGKAALDVFIRDLQGTDFDLIVVEGYADRLGPTAYNQTLSKQRADVVKDYLVNTGRLNPSRVSAVGKGETSPVTQDDCLGSRADARLIDCLQPDRHVVVEVTGTR